MQDGGGGVIPGSGPGSKPRGMEEVVERVGKKKRRTATTQGFTSRPWNREDAEKALAVEMEYQKVTGEDVYKRQVQFSLGF